MTDGRLLAQHRSARPGSGRKATFHWRWTMIAIGVTAALFAWPAAGIVQDASPKKSPAAASQADDAQQGDAQEKAKPKKEASTGATTTGAEDSTIGTRFQSWGILIAVILLVFVLPYWLGGKIAERWRMNQYGWRFGTVMATTMAALLILVGNWDFKENRLDIPLGVDLKGGVTLIYQVKDTATDAPVSKKKAGGDRQEGSVDLTALCGAIQNRIDPVGTQEIVVRPYGTRHVEVIIPQVGPQEVEHIKRLISTAGALEFRIVANRQDHFDEMELAREQAESDDVTLRNRREVFDENGEVVAFWVRVARADNEVQGVKPFKVGVSPRRELLRVAVHATDPDQQGRIVDIPVTAPDDPSRLAVFLDQRGIRHVDVLVIKDRWNVTGEYLAGVGRDFDERGRLSVAFSLKGEGAFLFGELTGANIPDPRTGVTRRLGIVLDNTLLSAPDIQSRIESHGRITGDFSEEEISFLLSILNSGRLPATLDERPISENTIGSMLGAETIRKGKISIAAALLSVLVFIVIYYRFAGVVACIALMLNLISILALMVLLNAPLTLPGLAGLVLTVGMSVDANVLIFERIREEMRRGAALRMAVRNGFDRATSTIVDANVTTLITAIVLYLIGTDQIRGFAVTLILGILMSMYTAIFVARIIFDTAERHWKFTQLKMMQALSEPKINFLGKRVIAGVVSLVLIVIGLGAVYERGSGLFDIDFNGGTSVTFLLRSSVAPDDVRKRLKERFAEAEKEAVQFTVNEISQQGRDPQTMYRVTSSLLDETVLIAHIAEAMKQGQSSLLETYTAEIKQLAPVKVSNGKEGADKGENRTQGTEVEMEFGEAINAATLLQQIHDAEQRAGVSFGEPLLSAYDETLGFHFVDSADLTRYQRWRLRFPADEASTRHAVEQLVKSVNARPVIPEASQIGGKVAGDAKRNARWAMLFSLFGIVGYIWFRFQRLEFGLAAVVALVHDVLITLGAIGVSKWLAGALGFLMIEEFKISLPVVAAFLTIIGYSLNDTIVVFDRIREVRGKSPDLTPEMINASINQTLSRTLLTSLTTLVVVAILFFFGGAGVHSFAFSLVVGVIVGTYSSIFIASPALLWMFTWSHQAQEQAAQAAKSAAM